MQEVRKIMYMKIFELLGINEIPADNPEDICFEFDLENSETMMAKKEFIEKELRENGWEIAFSDKWPRKSPILMRNPTTYRVVGTKNKK